MFEVSSGFCDFVQVDIMDGKFVPSVSIKAADIERINPQLNYEAHLMVINPLEYISGFKKAGAERIIFHFESNDDPHEVIKAIKRNHMKAGVAINPQTPVDRIRHLLTAVDLVLLMSVNPGYYGSEFIPAVMNKIKELRLENRRYLIAMDGGINQNNIKILKEKGLEVACVGSAIFRGNAEENYHNLFKRVSEPDGQGSDI